MDWPVSRQVERQAQRMREMVERMGVDAGRLVRQDAGAAYAQAHTRCLNCSTTRACLSWLESGKQAERTPEFCPNAALFDALIKPPAPDWQI